MIVSKIILLNGAGSSGKTSLAKAIQYLSNDTWLTFGIDTFIEMIPYKSQEKTNYFEFIEGKNERGVTTSVQTGPRSKQLFSLMPRFAQILAAEGNNIIIDEVLLDDATLENYAKVLSKYIVYYIGVHCNLKIMQEREILRRDRAIGLSNDQIDKVFQGKRKFFDFKVDTSYSSSFECARQIINFVNDNLSPEALKIRY